MTKAAEVPSGSTCADSSLPTAKTLKRKIFRNAFWNWLGVVAEISVAIFLTPFLIRLLGDTAYGTWIVIGSLTGYLGALDFGLRGAVGRHVAYYHARNDKDGLLRILNTAAFTLVLIGLISFFVVSLVAFFFGSMVTVPERLLPDACMALLIVGAHLALWLVLRIFDAALWGFERFDMLNWVDIPAAVTRGVASAVVVSRGHGLVGLACVTLGLTIVVGAAKLCLCHVVEPGIRPSASHIRRDTLRELFGYGFWNFLTSVAIIARTQLSPAIIGSCLGPAMVTPFSIVMRLLNTAAVIVSAGTGVLTPVATALHAHDDIERQRMLILDTGKFCVAAAVYFLSLFVFLGKPLLTLWIGPGMSWAWTPLVIMACGELVPMSVLMAENTILGMGKNRPLAFRGLAECVMALVLAVLLGSQLGLNGVCAGLAVSATCWRGIFLLLQANALVGLPPRRFIIQSVFPMFAAAAVPVATLGILVYFTSVTTWLALCLNAAVFSGVFVPLSALAALGVSRLRAYLPFASRLLAPKISI